MQNIIFMGHLTKDFEVRTTQEGLSVARGSMALNRGKDKDGNDRGADFPSLIAFGKTAETLEKYGKKGRRFLFECRVQTGSYTNKDGNKVYTTDFIIDRFEFADSKTDTAQPAPAPSDDFMSVAEDVDLPFN